MYQCEPCEFKTDVLCNFKKHNKTGKHIKNASDLHIPCCEFCGLLFDNKYKKCRHKKICPDNPDNIKLSFRRKVKQKVDISDNNDDDDNDNDDDNHDEDTNNGNINKDNTEYWKICEAKMNKILEVREIDKLENIVNVKRKYCDHGDCIMPAEYNFEEFKFGLLCKEHKLSGMINLSRKCLSKWCETIPVNPKYKGYCFNCFVHLFPNEKNSRNYKTKETIVSESIMTEFSEYNWIFDKTIGKSNKRPDAFLELKSQIIIVECDENQHKAYECLCENKRLMQLSLDMSHKNIVFIRFNPDSYIDINNKKIPSCWTLGKDGLLHVDKKEQKEWSNRLKILNETIKYWLNNKTTKMVEVIQLFYDQNIIENQKSDTESMETIAKKKL